MNRSSMDRGVTRKGQGRHTGSPETSRRLKTVLRIILRKRGATGKEIQVATGSESPHSDVSRLRLYFEEMGTKAPVTVLPAEFVRTTENGCRVHRFRAEKRQAARVAK